MCPPDYRDKPVYRDYLGAYARLFPRAKGSGQTSLDKGLNKRRQRQSDLVDRACGVHRKGKDELIERFFLLVGEHN